MSAAYQLRPNIPLILHMLAFKDLNFGTTGTHKMPSSAQWNQVRLLYLSELNNTDVTYLQKVKFLEVRSKHRQPKPGSE